MFYLCILSNWWLIIWTEKMEYPLFFSLSKIWPEVRTGNLKMKIMQKKTDFNKLIEPYWQFT